MFVLFASLAGAFGAYRYFIIPFELRFATTEALWIAGSFVGHALLAGAVLLLAAQERGKSRDE